MRLALFGGTFDPPHIGHLLAASDAYEALELDRVLWVPNAAQPFKLGAAVASPEQRLAMVDLMLAGDDRFEVTTVEVRRSGVSFTVDTVADFAERHPTATRFLLLGADAATQFDAWREPERIRQLAELVILARPGAAVVSPVAGARYVATRLVEVSSTEVRERVRSGRSIRGFVTDAVADYIESTALYR